MYKKFFGLRESPFNTNPDPRFLYSTDQALEALGQLVYGVQNRKGLILLTGEVGTGKTMLVNYLLDWLRQKKTPTAFIFNSHLSVNHLFDFILTDFGIPVDFKLKSNMLLHLNKWLIERYCAGETPVLIVDEAQGLSLELLEEIRLLLNLETASEKLLQIVLVGQPELEDNLKRPELRQLRQRIALRCSTRPLPLEVCCEYITERLRIAGATGGPIFTQEAMRAVHYYSQGIPRVMNLLCEHALINAYVEQLNPVAAEMVEEAARDFLLEFRGLPRHSGLSEHKNNSLSVMKSILTSQLGRQANAAEVSLKEMSDVGSPPTGASVEVGDAPISVGKNSSADSPPGVLSMSSLENLKEPAFPEDLISAATGVASPQRESSFCWDPTASRADSVAQLLSELKHNLAAALPVAKIHLVPATDEHERLSAPKGNRTPPSVNCAPTLDDVNRIPRYSPDTSNHPRFSHLEFLRPLFKRVFLLPILPRVRSHISAAKLRKVRIPIHPAHLLRFWIFDFKRDWIAMISSVRFLQLHKSVRRWLRQPISS